MCHVRLAQKIGMAAIAETAIAFHMYDALPHVLSAALGSVETTPMREAGAYAGLAAGGQEVVPTLIDSVQDRNGRVVWRPTALAVPDLRRCRPAAAARGRAHADRRSGQRVQLITMMEDVVTGGTGRAAAPGSTGRSPARPAPRRIGATPGSPASRLTS